MTCLTATAIVLWKLSTDSDDTSETEDEFAREMLELEDICAVDLVDDGPAPGPIPPGAKKGPKTSGGRMGVFVSHPSKIDTFPRKTVTSQNGLLIFFGKTHSEKKKP